MNPRLARLIDEVLEFTWRSSPTSATAAGIHDHDERLADFDPAALDDRLEELAGFRKALAELRGERPDLDPDEALDARVLGNALEVEERLLREVRAPFRDPSIYLDEILYGLYYVVQRQHAPFPERVRAASKRLLEVPRLLRQAAANLADPGEIPAAWLTSALDQIHGSLAFLSDLELQVAPSAGPAGPEFGAALREAGRALKDFERHLGERLSSRASGSLAVGRGLFDFLLRAQHGLDLDADHLQAFGTELVARTRERLAAAARSLDSARPWKDLVAAWKADHPTRASFLADYRREVDRAREFVRRRRLATLPPGERLNVIETPPFQRRVSPFAAYLPPGPFEKNQEGFFWATPPEDAAPPDEQEIWLQEHLRPGIPGTAAHEAYPGHHLQLTVANRNPSKVRRVFTTAVLVEGWAFYCEQMMGEEGFYEDPRSRVLQLKDELWRACRVVIDVGLQTRGMAVDEAAHTLRDVAGLETPTARGEALRYARTATQPMSYAVGKHEILRLRDDYRRLRGGAFTLQEFHDRLLSLGSIPVSLIRERLLGGA